MATKRTRITRSNSGRVTATAVEAYCAGDFQALHLALNLRPFQRSPLPIDVCGLGVGEGPPPDHDSGPWRDSWYTAQELQRELEAAIETVSTESTP